MHYMSLSRLALTAVFCAAGAHQAAPSPQEPPAPHLSARTALVVVHARVTDADGGAVTDLGQDAFVVRDDGVPQRISTFARAADPVAIGILMDNSTSMMAARDRAVAAASALVEARRPGDLFFVLHFNEQVADGVPGAPFTDDGTELTTALGRMRARGRTALYDALATGFERLAAAPLDKRVLVVLSDGEDTASTRRFQDVLAMARGRDVLVFGVTLEDPATGEARKPDALRQLVRATGGELFEPSRPRDLPRLRHLPSLPVRGGRRAHLRDPAVPLPRPAPAQPGRDGRPG